MTDLTFLTDRQLARLLEDIDKARKIALRPLLRYRVRRREIRAEMARRVSEGGRVIIERDDVGRGSKSLIKEDK